MILIMERSGLMTQGQQLIMMMSGVRSSSKRSKQQPLWDAGKNTALHLVTVSVFRGAE